MRAGPPFRQVGTVKIDEPQAHDAVSFCAHLVDAQHKIAIDLDDGTPTSSAERTEPFVSRDDPDQCRHQPVRARLSAEVRRKTREAHRGASAASAAGELARYATA